MNMVAKAIFCLQLAVINSSLGCDFICNGILDDRTFSHRVADADFVLQCRVKHWQPMKITLKENANIENIPLVGPLTLEIVDSHNTSKEKYKSGQQLVLDPETEYEAGEEIVVLGHIRLNEKRVLEDYFTIHAVDSGVFEYAIKAPHYSQSEVKRALYYIQHLQGAHSWTCYEAACDLQELNLNSLMVLSKKLNRKHLLSWLSNQKVRRHFRGHRNLFGFLVGVCGNKADAPLLEELILEESDPTLIMGYLILTGLDGLKHLEELALNSKKDDLNCTDILEASDLMLEHDPGGIPETEIYAFWKRCLSDDRLKENSDAISAVIWKLTYWKQWGSLELVTQHFRQCTDDGGEQEWINESVVDFLLYGLLDDTLSAASMNDFKSQLCRCHAEGQKTVEDALCHYFPEEINELCELYRKDVQMTAVAKATVNTLTAYANDGD